MTSFVQWNGGTKYYQAPELFEDGGTGKFYKKSDVFSAGIVYLEIISLRSPENLFKELWPRILGKGLASPLEQVLSGSLAMNTRERKSFDELFATLEEGKFILAEFCTNPENQQLFEEFLRQDQIQRLME